MTVTRWIGCLSALALCCSASLARTTYYVDNCGDDTWTGLSPICQPPDGPKATIQAAVDVAAAGDEVLVASGTYYGVVSLVDKGLVLRGTGGQPLLGDPIFIDLGSDYEGPGVTVEGFSFSTGWLGLGVSCDSLAPVDVRDCEFVGNHADAGGAADVHSSIGLVTFDGCLFALNGGENTFGGAMATTGHVLLMDCTFIDNWGDTGGALVLFGTSWIVDCTFQYNVAQHDAGAVAAWDDSILLLGCVFEGNTAANCPYCGLGDGGGLLCSGDVEIVDGAFRNNHAHNGGGLAFHLGSPRTSFSAFRENTAVMNGGAVYSFTAGKPLLESSTFTGNQAGFGGAMASLNSSPVVRSSTFQNNQAAWRGGTIRNTQGSSPSIIDCTFDFNSAPTSGGAISNNGSSPTVVGCRFQGNDSLQGGAMHNHASSSPTIANCLFIENTALERGGAVSGYFASPRLSNCTMIGNAASIEGGAVFLENLSLATVHNGIVRGNTPDQIGADLGSGFVVAYSNVQGGAVGQGNIDADPLFISGYHLGPGSPCIDAGGIWGVPMDLIDLDDDGDTCESMSIDGAGNRRFQDDPDEDNTGCGGRVYVDMGVYETPGSSIHTVRLGDCSDDDLVDVSDLTDVIVAWGPCPGQCCLADFDMDEDVDVDDLQTVILNWDCRP